MSLTSCKLSKLLNHSIWIVPKETLPAFSLNNNIISPVKDQTVWIIDTVLDNYVFGTYYLILNGVFISSSKIIGSITPFGDVLFSFYSPNEITTGQGKFLKENNEYKFLMQMNTLHNNDGTTSGLSHWSYMVRINECDCEYWKLPSTNLSIPKLLELAQ